MQDIMEIKAVLKRTKMLFRKHVSAVTSYCVIIFHSTCCMGYGGQLEYKPDILNFEILHLF